MRAIRDFGTFLSAKRNERKRALIKTNPERVPSLALAPNPKDVLAGKATGTQAQKIAAEGARTVPDRENGGNHDIKNFTRGSRVFYPVQCAKFSDADLHFTQGDGEMPFCGAIEIGGFVDFGVDLIKGGMAKYGSTTNPVFMPGNVTLLGVSQLCLRRSPIKRELLPRCNDSIEGRISGIVDIPKPCRTIYLPTAIFDFAAKTSRRKSLTLNVTSWFSPCALA